MFQPKTALIFSALLAVVALCIAYEAEDGEENELMLNLFRHGYQKRGDFQVHTFPCNGFDYAPRCLHGGKGPKDLKTNKGRLCACLCPSPWQGPECKDLVI